jgi:cell division protein FtsW (lipid II flippase)
MDVRTTFIIGIAALLFTMYYLEKEIEKRQIFWLYAGIGIVMGIISVRTVVKDLPNFDYYITFAVLSILIAILYHDEPEEEAEPPKKEKKKKKKRKGR